MTNFHSRIMNLPFDRPISSPEYATGHRDARHAAAEIANEADALAARLAEADALIAFLRKYAVFPDGGTDSAEALPWRCCGIYITASYCPACLNRRPETVTGATND
jgi:hypothetical protein